MEIAMDRGHPAVTPPDYGYRPRVLVPEISARTPKKFGVSWPWFVPTRHGFEVRNKLVPINKALNIAELKKRCGPILGSAF